jgi:hypothetical protein
LQDGAGNSFSKHEDKAKILWETFKERLGTTDFNHMLFNLNDLLIASDNLNSLEIPFSKQEIDKVVSELPNNKSPGPDGFNNEFVKGCWDLIASDFYKLFESCFDRNPCLRSLNNSHIALIPKKRWPNFSI